MSDATVGILDPYGRPLPARSDARVRRSLEDPRTSLSDPDEWLYDAMGGGRRSSSGLRVNRETALTYSAVWRAKNMISRDIGKIPTILYKRTSNGKERASEHPAYRLLRYKPNREMNAYQFKMTLQNHALDGNGYAYVFRKGDGTPEELIPLNPDNTYPVRENGRLLYVTTFTMKNEQHMRKLLPENVIHIKGLGFDGLIGYSVIQKARESLGLGMAAAEYGSRFFSNGVRPSVVLEHPGLLNEEAEGRLRSSWEKMHQGLDNSHRLAILEDGLKLKPLSFNSKDSQLLETRQFEIREVANWYGVPPHKLGDTTRTAYASLEQENQGYLDDALDGWMVNWEMECYDKTLSEKEKASDSHFIEFLRQALVRTDLKTRGEYFKAALGGNPWMVPDEVRSLENLNDLEDGEGKKYVRPQNITGKPEENDEDADTPPARPMPPALAKSDDDDEDEQKKKKKAKEEAEAEEEEDKARKERASEQLMRDAVARMTKRIGTQARRASKKPEQFPEWLNTVRAEHESVVQETLLPVCALRGNEFVISKQITDRIFEVTRSALAECVQQGGADDFSERVSRSMDLVEKTLPEAISKGGNHGTSIHQQQPDQN